MADAPSYVPGSEFPPPNLGPGTSVQDMVDALKGVGQAAQQLPLVGHMIQGFQAPHDAYSSTSADPYTTDKAYGDAQNMMSLMSGGVGKAEEGAAGIFGGKLARTSQDGGKFTDAMNAEMDGIHPSDIWNGTGWFRGNSPSDNKWRFEIDDSQARINPNFIWNGLRGATARPPPFPTAVGGYFNHPELYEAYPQLQSMKLSRETNPEYAGAYYRDTPEIKVKAGQPLDQARDVMLHELQHAVQNVEGFNMGSHWQNFYPEGYAPLKGELKNRDASFANWLEGHLGYDGKTAVSNLKAYLSKQPHNQEILNDVVNTVNSTGKGADFANYLKAHQLAGEQFEKPAVMQYKLSPGELEARNVELRSDYSPLERSFNNPLATQDLIVKALKGQQ